MLAWKLQWALDDDPVGLESNIGFCGGSQCAGAIPTIDKSPRWPWKLKRAFHGDPFEFEVGIGVCWFSRRPGAASTTEKSPCRHGN